MKTWMRIALIAVLPVWAGCENDGTDAGPDPADDLAYIRLQIGSQTVNVLPSSGASATVTVPRGTYTVTAAFRRADNTVLNLRADDGFTVNFTPSTSGSVAFTRTDAFSGTLTALQAGSFQLTISLMHGTHEDFPSRVVNITVTQDGGNLPPS